MNSAKHCTEPLGKVKIQLQGKTQLFGWITPATLCGPKRGHATDSEARYLLCNGLLCNFDWWSQLGATARKVKRGKRSGAASENKNPFIQKFENYVIQK